jgi:hypothetical protein
VSDAPDIPTVSAGAALPELGRARRHRLTESEGELWLLGEEDRSAWRRLLELGAVGIGRFRRGGQHGAQLWLERAPATPTLSEVVDAGGALQLGMALGITRSLLSALAFAEAEALFPGALSLTEIAVDETNVHVAADALVQAVVGEQDPSRLGRSSRTSPRWTPPEQSDGSPWNNTANRYVAGLILYRLLSGEHAFGGRGLRLSLEARAGRPPAPFAPELAQQLPPGLQSLCLRSLDPDPEQRPRNAQEMLDTLASITDGAAPAAVATAKTLTAPGASTKSPKPRAAKPEPPAAKPEPPAAKPEPPARKPAQPAATLDVGHTPAPRVSRASSAVTRSRGLVFSLALGLTAGALFWWGLPRGATPERTPLKQRAPLAAAKMSSEDCASCHPRQAGEWRRSVMAHSVKSPLFQSLEMLIEEQVGRDFDCPNGAGALRRADPSTACRDRQSGQLVTGSGGEHWCVNCHSPADNLGSTVPAWNARRSDNPTLRDVLSDRALEGISCGFCHQVHGPGATRSAASELGNPFWVSAATGRRFDARPEDSRGQLGISNSGYALDPQLFLRGDRVPGGAHARPDEQTRAYLRSSDFCGACHDVRLFGTDVVGIRERGEHFKRLRNAYSEWAAWAELEQRAGRTAASCQDCHMSQYPGVCVQTSGEGPPAASAPGTTIGEACPPGTRFSARAPGSYPMGLAATASSKSRPLSLHYFSGVEVPLDPSFDERLAAGDWTDVFSLPQSLTRRAKMLLAASVQLSLGQPRTIGRSLELPVGIENVGAGHRVPAGFSQERELWVHLTVSDESGRVLYEVGRVDRPDQDLRDKVFLRVNTDDRFLDGQGRPQGLFGADVADGPDVPRWQPNPSRGGTRFRGLGLINFQNGFLRCVVCIGRVESDGSCSALPGQDRTRADRFADGNYDIDTGECTSNLSGEDALFETYFPVGALDASRGVLKAPDAIIDRRSLAPGQPVTFTYDLRLSGRPKRVDARLLFRAFPPFLLRAFAEYEAKKRPGRPLLTADVLDRLEIFELARARVELP